jgi:NAD(P)H-dependent flavin oxidoreductase YrpB (nitropropane dioxygenase family)
MSGPRHPLPRIIQGGMGVGISSSALAREVARHGGLGVVSGTALEAVCARRLQDGDVGGHIRRALAAFPVPRIAERIVSAYHVPGGRDPAAPYRNVPMWSTRPARMLQELTVAANFVEVFLAKEGHGGPIGINYLRKIESPLPFACYGAILAGVDYVLVGAGNPSELPGLLTRLARHEDAGIPVRIQGRSSAEGEVRIECRPEELGVDPELPLRRPALLAIVASVDLAAGLAASPEHRPDGFVIEGPTAGGHNAPPRGPRRSDELGQPVYGGDDEVDLAAIAALGLPFWLAGSYATPEGLRDALAAGAAGIQVGTLFALSDESGLEADLKRRVLRQVRDGTTAVRTDWRASPTGFPFKVLQLEGTLSDDAVYADRGRICDLGALRSPYTKPDRSIGYRCPAEPLHSYVDQKGGREQNTTGRVCLCNALLASTGLAQHRRDGTVEPALVTSGGDLTAVARLLDRLPVAAPTYSAAEAVAYLQTEAPSAQRG